MAFDYRVLVVDDERSIRNVLKIHFRRQGIYCDTAASMYEAFKKIEEKPFHLFILDLKLPDGDGIQVLREVKKRYPHSVALMITAYGTIEKAVEAIKLGAFDFITKPFKMSEFKTLVELAFKQLDLKGALEEREEGILKDLGRSGAIKDLEALVSRFAPSDVSVLIVGESGTGKYLVARALHRLSVRREGPFEFIEIPRDLPHGLEEELFGQHFPQGEGRTGMLELARGGTLYLGRLENMPLHLQGRLLSTLEEGRYRVPGGVEVRDVGVRFIFSVEEDPSLLVEKGRLMEEFYYRLKNLKITIPPLRERKEDVPYLLNRFIREFSQKYEKRITGFTPGFLRAIGNYPFPGNVRELESLVERCVVLTSREVLHEDLLPPDLKGDHGETLDELLESIEKEMIIKALKQAGGVKTRAADILGISFRSLRYRMKKLGLKD